MSAGHLWPTVLTLAMFELYKLYGMENSIPVQIPFPQPPAEPSDNSAPHLSGNGYKANPVYQIIIYMIINLIHRKVIQVGYQDVMSSGFLFIRSYG